MAGRLRGIGEGVGQYDLDRSIVFRLGEFHERKLGWGKRQADLYGGAAENLAKRGGRTDGLADADNAGFNAAIEGGSDFGAVEVAAGLFKIRLRGADISLRLAELRHTEHEGRGFLVVSDVLPVQTGLFRTSLLLDQRGLGAGEAGFGGEHGGLKVGGI